MRSSVVFRRSPSPLGTLAKTASGVPSLAVAVLPFHTGTTLTSLPASNRRTVSQACQPQFSSFWLSAARDSFDTAPSTTDSSRRLPAGVSRTALATRQSPAAAV